MDFDEAVVNSCRVCRCSNEEGDAECLYVENVNQLSAAGQLYEELVGLQIDRNTAYFYPRYICNSCDLQMKLYKKLKNKANQTLQELTLKYTLEEIDNNGKLQNSDEHSVQNIKQDMILQTFLYETHDDDQNEDLISTDVKPLVTCEDTTGDDVYEETDGAAKSEEVEHIEPLNDVEYVDELTEEFNEIDEIINADYEVFGTTEDEIVPSNDEGDNLNTAVTIAEQIADENSDQKPTGESTDFMDVHYLEDVLDDQILAALLNEVDNNEKLFNCTTCNSVFNKRSDFLKHKKEHSARLACPECTRTFQTTESLNVHLRQHRGLPAYQCELCSKTFKQKVHFNYHMAKHNNIRKYKCDICEKRCIAKGDLAIHMRSHTGDRRYSCDICQKEFLLLIHMKNHRYSHFEKGFECKICLQKFVSPSTLRTHTQSIHENEPRFQCEYCVKKFRRKHHLLSHYKVHRKLNKDDEFIDRDSNCEDEPSADISPDEMLIEKTEN